jgi:hypothetical protein
MPGKRGNAEIGNRLRKSEKRETSAVAKEALADMSADRRAGQEQKAEAADKGGMKQGSRAGADTGRNCSMLALCCARFGPIPLLSCIPPSSQYGGLCQITV